MRYDYFSESLSLEIFLIKHMDFKEYYNIFA